MAFGFFLKGEWIPKGHLVPGNPFLLFVLAPRKTGGKRGGAWGAFHAGLGATDAGQDVLDAPVLLRPASLLPLRPSAPRPVWPQPAQSSLVSACPLQIVSCTVHESHLPEATAADKPSLPGLVRGLACSVGSAVSKAPGCGPQQRTKAVDKETMEVASGVDVLCCYLCVANLTP